MRQLRRATAIVAGLAVLIGMVGGASGQTLDKVGEWTYGPAASEAVARDPERNLLFLGDGGDILFVDVSDIENPSVSARMTTPGNVRGFFYEAPYLYAADGLDGGLRIIDVADVNAPSEVGFTLTLGSALDVEVMEEVAYIADGPGGMYMVDVSAPAAPLELGFFETTDANAVFVETRTDPVLQRRAYVADGNGGLRIIDVTDPANAAILGTFDTSGSAMDVAVEGDVAYIADGAAGLRILNIADLAAIVEVGFQTQIGNALNFHVAGSDIYIAGGTAGLSIVDAATLMDPVLMATADTEGTALEAALGGYYAYVANGEGGLAIYDVSDPTHPVLTSRYPGPRYANDIAATGGIACLTDGTPLLHILDVTDPASPAPFGAVDLGDEGRAVACNGDTAYVIEGSTTLRMINLTAPGAPEKIGAFTELKDGKDVFATPTHAYVADGAFGLKVIDAATTPETPILAGSLPTPGTASGVFVAGDHAFVADGEAGLFIVDVSAPDSLRETGFLDTEGTAMAVVVAGDDAYVADGAGGVAIIDVSNPASPLPVAVLSEIANAVDVAVSGNYLHVAAQGGGVYTYFIGEPGLPEEIVYSGTEGAAEALALSGEHLFVANGERGMAAMRFTPPGPLPAPAAEPPTEVSAFRFVANWQGVEGAGVYEVDVATTPDFSVPVSGYVGRETTDTRMAIEGLQPDATYYYRVRSVGYGTSSVDSNVITAATEPEFRQVGAWTLDAAYTIEFNAAQQTVYLGSGSDVYAIDASTPSDLRQADKLEFRTIRDLLHLDDRLYVANDRGGLRIVDAANPRAMYEIARYPAEGAPQRNVHGVFVENDRAFIAEAFDGGISVIDLSPAFDDPAAAPVRISGYSLNGVSDVHFHNGRIYATDAVGLRIFGFLDEEIIGLIGTYTIPDASESFESVHVEGDYAYVAGSGGLRILDVSNPTNPFQAAMFPTPRRAMAVHFLADFLHLTDGETLYVLDVGDPAAPEETTRFTLSGRAEDLTAWGPYIFIADGESGLKVLRYQYPQRPPGGLDAGDITDRSFMATWNETAGAVAYRLEVSETEDFSSLLPGYAGLPVEDTTQEVVGLSHGTVYYYRVIPVLLDQDGLPSATFTVETEPSMEPGDLDGNGVVDLNDGVIALKVIVGISPSGLRADYAGAGVDIDGNGRVGLAEAFFSLRAAAGAR